MFSAFDKRNERQSLSDSSKVTIGENIFTWRLTLFFPDSLCWILQDKSKQKSVWCVESKEEWEFKRKKRVLNFEE